MARLVVVVLIVVVVVLVVVGGLVGFLVVGLYGLSILLEKPLLLIEDFSLPSMSGD